MTNVTLRLKNMKTNAEVRLETLGLEPDHGLMFVSFIRKEVYVTSDVQILIWVFVIKVVRRIRIIVYLPLLRDKGLA